MRSNAYRSDIQRSLTEMFSDHKEIILGIET